MKIIVSGSLDFAEKIMDLKLRLEEIGHKVIVPVPIPDSKTELPIKIRQSVLKDFFSAIQKADALLIANYEHEGTMGYIGPSTYADLIVAFYLDKQIFLLNSIPQMPLKDEVEAMMPVILHNDLSKI